MRVIIVKNVRLIIGYLHFEGRKMCQTVACKIHSREVGGEDAPIGDA